MVLMVALFTALSKWTSIGWDNIYITIECRFLLNNIDWLEEEIGNYDDDYLIIDCPGQIELYTHFPIMKRVCEALERWNMRICGVYCLESQFIEDKYKYFSGVMSAMSAMVNMEIPHVNIMTKMDLIEGDYGNKKEDEQDNGEQEDEMDKKARRRRRRRRMESALTQRELERYLDPDPLLIAERAGDATQETSTMNQRFQALNQAIVQLVCIWYISISLVILMIIYP